MKKITLTKLKKQLSSNNVDDTTIELIINNTILYNTLIDNYLEGKQVNTYLIYQLNSQIQKQITTAKVKNEKSNEGEASTEDFIKSFKKKIEKRNE